MDMRNEKAKLSDEELDLAVGGIEDQPLSVTREPDGECPKCGPGSIAYRVTETGTLGPFQYTKTHRECPVHGWLSV